MANIPLKSIKFPDLADTYTVPSNAGELPYNKSATYPDDTVGKALQNIGDSVAPSIIETAQGSIASFDDGADDIPVKSLVADIVPIQSGSGDPSPDNVRPITGWTECNVVVSPTEDAQDGETHTISFASAGTVYGGRLDVTSGVLVVDRAYATIDGQADGEPRFTEVDQTTTADGSKYVAYIPLSAFGMANNNEMMADSYKYLNANTTLLHVGQFNAVGTYARFVIADQTLDTLAKLNNYLSGNPLHIVYQLETPQTYQLTPTEVKTLLGNNNVWADTGDVTVEYVADTKTFIENLVNA